VIPLVVAIIFGIKLKDDFDDTSFLLPPIYTNGTAVLLIVAV
jgi:hypothetical protein